MALKRLERLSLVGANLNDAGIKHLAGLTNLESLDLRRTKATAVGKLGVAELQDRLERDAGQVTARLERKEQANRFSAPDGGQETLTPAEMAKK